MIRDRQTPRTRFSAWSMLACLCLMALPCAALEPAYLGDMPDPVRVTRDFAGEDRLDTLALQVAALSRLNRILLEMAGQRRYQPGQYPTPDEARITEAVRRVSGPLEAEAEATFDPKLTGIDTPRAQWRLKVNDYEYSPQLYARIMALYFSPEFRAAHLATMADKEELERAVSEQMERGQRALEGVPEPVAAADHTRALQLGAAMALLIVLGGAYLIPRTRISTSEPYTFRIGLRRYTLVWASGTVANYRERETRGIAYIRDANTPIGHEGKRTSFIDNVYEDFTLEGPTGSQPIQITGKGAQASRLFQAQVGQPLTAIWVTRNGVRRYLRFQLNEGYSVENEHIKTSLAQLFPIPGWTALPALALGYIVGDAMAPFEFSGLVFAMVAFPLWGATFSLLTWQRRRAFERDELEALGKRLAAGTLPTPG